MNVQHNVARNKRPPIIEQFKMQKRGFKIFYISMWVLVIMSLVENFIVKNYENVFTSVLTLFLFALPLYIERIVDIDLPDTLIVIIVLFIFAADILGEMFAWYERFAWWDTMLHTLNGFLAAAVGFSLINILNNSDSMTFEMSPCFVVLSAFCFSMTIGVLWEFFEFGMDTIFLTDMQKDTVVNSFATVMLDPTKSNIAIPVTNITDVMVNGESLGLGGYLDIGIYDTMADLGVNFIGATVFSCLGYFYLKKPKKFSWIKGLIPTRTSTEEYKS